MPGKQRQRKGKYAYQEKIRGGQAPIRTASEQTTAAGESGSTGVSSRPAPQRTMPAAPRTPVSRQVRAGAQMPKASGMRYEFVGKELRNIGILAAATLILLFIIARIIA